MCTDVCCGCVSNVVICVCKSQIISRKSWLYIGINVCFGRICVNKTITHLTYMRACTNRHIHKHIYIRIMRFAGHSRPTWSHAHSKIYHRASQCSQTCIKRASSAHRCNRCNRCNKPAECGGNVVALTVFAAGGSGCYIAHGM